MSERELLEAFVEFLEEHGGEVGDPSGVIDLTPAEAKTLISTFLATFGQSYIQRCLRESVFGYQIPALVASVSAGGPGPFIQPIDIETENFPISFPSRLQANLEKLERIESSPHLLVGKKGNRWSDQAEEALAGAGIDYRFETISTPPHPRPETIPGADPLIRRIPTLLMDYHVKDEAGDMHHIRVELASGVDEVVRWVELTVQLQEPPSPA